MSNKAPPHCAALDDDHAGKVADARPSMRSLDAEGNSCHIRRTGSQGVGPPVSEIYHNVGCTINFGTFPAGPSLMLAGWREIFRGGDGTVACDLDWERG